MVRWTSVALALSLGMLMPACGGGGGDDDGGNGGNNTGPLTATFMPANPTPGNQTLSMSGSSAGAMFSITVNVTQITNFFGAAFDLTYDPATVSFQGSSSASSVLVTNNPSAQPPQFNVDASTPGSIEVAATLVGQVEGIDVAATTQLITFNFQATGTTGGNAFGFGAAANRLVRTCPTPPGACTDIPDGNITWSGGTLTASR